MKHFAKRRSTIQRAIRSSVAARPQRTAVDVWFFAVGIHTSSTRTEFLFIGESKI